MATKKQRRRREKERRHEYETVFVDEHGAEVEVEEPAKPAKAEARKDSGGQRGAQRVIEPPSWNKVLRRSVIFAPLILIFLYLTSKDRSSYSAYLSAIPLLILLPAVMYLTDSVLYRSYLKRTGKGGGTQPKS
jgi:hypothetical protein